LEFACCCGPQWGVVASWVYLDRDQLDGGALLLNNAGGAALLDAAQLDFEHVSGFDVSASYAVDVCSAYEIRCLWLDDWTAAARVANPGLIDINTAVVTGPFAATTFDTAYRSRFNSIEAGARRGLGGSTLLVGFRYAQLDELLAIRGFGAAAESNTRFGTQNDLYGLQVGLARDCWRPCSSWGVGAFAKGGLYYNSADVDASLIVGGAPVGAAADRTDGLALLGEAGVDLLWSVRPNLTVRAGYRLLVIDGVAIAAEQLAGTGALTAANPPLVGDDDGSLFAHGLSAALELAW
jgi:hypothetical protein